MRIGHGYDVHRFAARRRLILCGEEIPYELGLLGHSDADVAVHALMDAILGAASLGDIGRPFPDNDPKYEGADSIKLLEAVMELISDRGFSVSNADVTIIAQKPKLMPFIEKMKNNLAHSLRVSSNRVNVKATTEEGLGFTGSLEGISAHAVVLLNE
ncbi:MAG: 2-C-methyl-D-erythritol 2,4-cyclodiphosphate synthase [Oscillospiraceae bacterium]|nr:2-C-methyl-D-erythritol 2,4-cyclodiphosphate synthase [Oscillospiraceae bacterium]